MVDFCHLHGHNEYSVLDGYGTAEKFAEVARQLGQPALALTNHGNVDGAIKFQKACVAAGVKPIFGCELYVVEDRASRPKGEKRCHLTAIVKNADGWRNLLRMLTVANLEGFYKRPRVDPSLVLSCCDGLAFLSGCTSSVLGAGWGEALIKKLIDVARDDVFFEIMHHDYAEQVRANKLAMRMAVESGARLVATGDYHYPLAADRETQEVLLAIQSKARWSDPNRWRFCADSYYVASGVDILRSYRKYHQYIDARTARDAMRCAIDIADGCDFMIPKLPVALPMVPGYEGCDESELLRKMARRGLIERVVSKKRKRKKPVAEYRRRMGEELDLICQLGFQRYFLIVWDLIKWCKSDGNVLVGPGRGSVGGCLVAYLLGITDVDPLEYDLLFARFISSARIDLPDIDMDFEDRKRHLVKERLEQMYGKECVAGLSTYLTMKGRGAVRDVARVFGIPNVDADKAAKSIVARSVGDFRASFTIDDAFGTFEDGIAFKRKYPDATRYAIKLETTVRGCGQHAAAVCVAPEPLSNGKHAVLALRSGNVVVNWDKEDAEYCGLMKLDVLGLSTLSVISESVMLIRRNCGVNIVWDEIALDDARVYSEIALGNTVGGFQIGSPALARYCREFKPESFDDLVSINALWRPGILRTGMAAQFVARKRGEVDWDYGHPSLEPLTKDTFGIILYQEQVMQFMYENAGLPWRTCDMVRKVISKRQGDELFMAYEGIFADGCVAKGTMARDEACKLWRSLSSFGSYSFNKSHAVEYAMIAYWTMWLKVNYPSEFVAAALTCADSEKKQELIREAMRLGLKVVPPKFGISHAKQWNAIGNVLYAPFCEIVGVGDKVSEALADMVVGNGQVLRPSRTVNRAVVAKLELLKAQDVDAVDWADEEAAALAPLLSFNFSHDMLGDIRGVQKLMADAGYDVARVMGIDFANPSRDAKWYFGKMHELRLGYRKSALRATTSDVEGKAVDTAGLCGNLGGAYGVFTDFTDACMLVFDEALYSANKEAVEHCAGQIIAVKASHPHRQTALFAHELLLEEDLRQGRLWVSGVVRHQADRQVLMQSELFQKMSECHACSLRSECSKPVLPSIGRLNIAVIGEAPGRTEDQHGAGFLGDAGKVLWEEMGKVGIKRGDACATNVIKCWPSQTKTPTARHIASCSRWLDKELSEVKPVAILALGGTALKFFKGKDATGITALNATIEWDRKYQAWICWGVHPASVLYHQENLPLLAAAVAEFADLTKRL